MVADKEVEMVADMEVDKVVDKVADMVADMVADKKKMTSNLVDSWLRRLVNWAQTFMTRSLPDLRVF